MAIKITSFRKNCWLLAMLLLLTSAQFQLAISQITLQNIFTSATWNSGSLTGESSIRYGKISSNISSINDIFPINIQNLASTQYQGRLLVDIPGNECGPSIFKARHVEYVSESDYLWEGEIEVEDHCQCEIGEMILRSKNGEKFGIIHLGENSYSIEDLTGGKNLIFKYPTIPDGTVLACDVIGGGSQEQVATQILERSIACFCQTRVTIDIYGSI